MTTTAPPHAFQQGVTGHCIRPVARPTGAGVCGKPEDAPEHRPSALVPCEVQEVWHIEDECRTRFVCERPGQVQTITTRVRDALEVARRSGEPEMQRVAVWLVEGTVGGEGS